MKTKADCNKKLLKLYKYVIPIGFITLAGICVGIVRLCMIGNDYQTLIK